VILPGTCHCGLSVVLRSSPWRWENEKTETACTHDPTQGVQAELAKLIAEQQREMQYPTVQLRERGWFRIAPLDTFEGWKL